MKLNETFKLIVSLICFMVYQDIRSYQLKLLLFFLSSKKKKNYYFIFLKMKQFQIGDKNQSEQLFCR